MRSSWRRSPDALAVLDTFASRDEQGLDVLARNREAAERFVACNGGRVLAATADSVTLELDVPVTALLQAVEAEPFMAVDPKMCRRDVPCFSVSHRSARSHVHELGGSLLPSLVPKKLREAAKKVWDRFAHGKRSKCAHTACEEQEVEETEDEGEGATHTLPAKLRGQLKAIANVADDHDSFMEQAFAELTLDDDAEAAVADEDFYNSLKAG